MRLARYWATPYDVGDEWNEVLCVSPERLALSYPNGVLQVQENGFRYGERRVFESESLTIALGGSTTFGHFCLAEDSWPEQLGRLTSQKVVNLGQPKSDIWMSLQNLLHYIRINPDVRINRVISYDGVNQNGGYNQYLRNAEKYRPEHTNYQQMNLIFETYRKVTGSKFSRHQILFFLFGRKYREILLKKISASNKNIRERQQTLEYFAGEEARIYCKTLQVMRGVVEKFTNSQLINFLQPCLFDYFEPRGEDVSKAIYLRTFYESVNELDKHVISLRYVTNLEPSDFIDWAHLTPAGNFKIAQEISKSIETFNV